MICQTCTNMSISKCSPSGSLPTRLIFFHITHRLSHNAFFLCPEAIVAMDTTEAMHAHNMINVLFHAYRKYHSSS